MDITVQDIINFWFSARVKPLWFKSTPEFDTDLKKQFSEIYAYAVEGKLLSWQDSPEGCLALVIILDQLPLNMYRGEKKSFATEADAIQIARLAVSKGFDQQLAPEEKMFLYMPFMHSELLEDQDTSVALFEKAGLVENVRFARHHRSIVEKFGRFPHRNSILNRQSTDEELAYLQSDEAFHG